MLLLHVAFSFSLSPLLSLDYVLKDVMYSIAFVCLLARLEKTARLIFMKVGGEAERGQRKCPLNLGVYSSDRAAVPLLGVCVCLSI